MGNAAFLRRFSMAAMLIAIAAGLVSVVQLFLAPGPDATMLGISLGAFLIGLVMDRRARKLDDSNAGR